MRPGWVAVCVGAYLAAGCTADPPAPVSPPVAVGRLAVGTAGCGSRSCHGGLDSSAVGSETAATAWHRWDRHARAYEALQPRPSEPGFPDAAAMIRHLQKGDASWQEATAEPRCLACHVTPSLATRTGPAAARLHADGVGCEACHTAPGRRTDDWLGPHTRGWVAGGLADCFAGGAMRTLDGARARAEACVGCHVGATAADGVPAREVTHDLIAAGHPRLNFEFLSALDRMPPHWGAARTATGGQPRRIESGPDQWLAGQLAAADAALALATDRAAGGRVELADRNCFACHHGLDPSGRRVAGSSPLVSAPLMRLLGWGEAERRALAAPAEGSLRELRRKLSPVPVDAARLAAATSGGGDWDAAVQGYHALRAADQRHQAAKGRLDLLAKALRLTPTANSPVGYDPAAAGRLAADAAAVFDVSPKR